MTESGIVEAGTGVEAGSASGNAGQGVFYRIDGAKGTLREYWWSAKPRWTFPLVVLLMKALRVKTPVSTDDPCVETLQPFESAGGIESFPADARALVEPMVREMEGLGFEGPIACRRIDDVLHATETYLVTMRARSGEGIGRAHVRVWRVRQPARVVSFVEFMTPLEGGGGVWSLGSKPDLEAPPEWRAVRRPGAAAGALWAEHRAEVARAGRPATPIADDGDARTAEESHHAAARDFHLRRGIFAPLTEADHKRVQGIRQAREAMADGAEADVLAEIERMGQKRRGWGGALLILAVSLALFVLAGKSPADDTSGMASSWEMMAIIVGVLFVHELGHYVAMRVFGYRNLRMFFIPFFGAAVSGRHYNVAGWKKVVVSLMGPVPGIVLGVIIGLTGLVLKKSILTKIGLMALILNGFNLFPVLPLDGGWVAHALIFSRNYVLDAAFRLVAAGAVIAGGVVMQQKFFMYMGIASLIALPATLKLARVVAGLRRDGIRAASTDDQTIPPDVAREIIGRVRAAFPKGATTRVLAQHTTHVFETLNARPPGWLATLGLGSVHVGSFVLALVFAVVLVIGERPDLLRNRLFQGPTPKHTVTAGAMQTWPGESSPAQTAGGDRQTIVATFDRTALAAGAFDAARGALPDGGAVRLFGETVMASVPAADDDGRKRVLRVMQGRTKDVFVAGADTPAGIVLTCMAPNEQTAADITEEAKAYFGVPAAAHLLPPWADPDTRSDEERAHHLLARQTYARLQAAQSAGFSEKGFLDLFQKMAKARREGDRAELQRLESEQRKLMIELPEQKMREIRDEGEGKVDVALANRYIELRRAGGESQATPDDSQDEDFGAYQKLATELGPRMGQITMTPAGKPAPGADRQSAKTGVVKHDGAKLTFQWVMLNDPYDGAPALVRWLETKGCTQVKYSFTGGEGWGQGDGNESPN